MAAASSVPAGAASDPQGWWISALRLTDFRNYAHLALDLAPGPVVLAGQNGAGKTNLLEAISFLSPGRGLRTAAYDEIAREGGRDGWAVFARVAGPHGEAEIGTGFSAAASGDGGRAGREVRIDGERARSVSDLAYACRMIWLTPAMDGLFTGPAADRRRFLDGLVQAIDPGHRRRVTAFEIAMRQRNALFEQPRHDANLCAALEAQMAEHAVAVAAARQDCVRLLQGVIAGRDSAGIFPDARLALDGEIEADLAVMPATDAEDRYRDRLAAGRALDAAARRALSGPHRADLVVWHGPKAREARLCSTGEQKMLLIGLVLAHARLVGALSHGAAPLVLLDEVAAHLDARHRAALFDELAALGTQAWMTGTDLALFADCIAGVQLFHVADGQLRRAG